MACFPLILLLLAGLTIIAAIAFAGLRGAGGLTAHAALLVDLPAARRPADFRSYVHFATFGCSKNRAPPLGEIHSDLAATALRSLLHNRQRIRRDGG